MKKTKVKILRNTIAAQKPVKIGDIVELEAGEARLLINIKKAQLVTETIQPKVDEVLADDEIEQKSEKTKRKKRFED